MKFSQIVILTIFTAFAAGCLTPDAEKKGKIPPSLLGSEALEPDQKALLEKAQMQYQRGDYKSAMVDLVSLAFYYPDTPGAEDLRGQVVAAELDRRSRQALQREDELRRSMALNTKEAASMPDSMLLKGYIQGDTNTLFEVSGPMQEILDIPVSLHLKKGDLGAFITLLSDDDRINIIADSDLGKGKVVDIDVDDVPLTEILEYLTRNMGVSFYFGESMIWATSAAAVKEHPLETRLYKLKKGVQFHGSDWGEQAKGKGEDLRSDLGLLSRKATVLSKERIYLEELIDQFVPKVEGSVTHFDKNTHTLFVRNTRRNFVDVEMIIESVDVNPVQVFIEARFVEVSTSDLHELGIEWMLDSPFVVNQDTTMENGVATRSARTQVAGGAGVSYAPFTSDDAGSFALGPQGSFGSTRAGNPATTGQGLNLDFQGILTDPMFTAVLHALDISGKGRTLSVPRVTTLNNNPAKLRNGEDLRYYEEFEAQAFQLLDDNNKRVTLTALVPKGKPAMEELGITLVAVPSVGADNRTIQLMIQPTISRLEGFLAFQDGGDSSSTSDDTQSNISQVEVKLPIFERREIQTKVMVDSGETVVMGGLIDTVKVDVDHKIPILSDIPLIGKLFTRKDSTEENRNLMVFVTASVISERGVSMVAPPVDVEGRAPNPLQR